MGKMSEESLGPGYSLNAWHLHLFGVHPGHHGKGYGRALFEFVERQVRRIRAAAGMDVV
jgi:GNAT superfamily N-acetyltransferase